MPKTTEALFSALISAGSKPVNVRGGKDSKSSSKNQDPVKEVQDIKIDIQSYSSIIS